MKNSIDEQTIINLKEKIDALVQRGSELSKNLSVDERYNTMKKVILEGVHKALLNTSGDGEGDLSQEEFAQKKDQLIDFVREYFEEKFSESLAMEWDENGGAD
jgi:hypothetical protein